MCASTLLAPPALARIVTGTVTADQTAIPGVNISNGEWQPMEHTEQPDPRILAENLADDAAETLRGYDRIPEARPSTHLWRTRLPTDLPAGEHRIEIRAFDRWRGELRAETQYRLVEAALRKALSSQ